ncbi:16S rRNA (guanine(527)-N(7))-methyltransferase RsmG [Candidatus Schmidhempelia bombi]|jgi:16S rRNA (guanine527-N7)-methyltransferase|uniref:Ribosomal RNA small subunit methyltransferase G n=1 Tax=Candidatus Schmidhempelia bombi str. Bimp TaxID=1387197 RepID=A0AB94IDC8_9GAMM|nr:16S rRNA (guanine(527)-N(7))-methyltransferase RsmG [Candidatus Schmidhempelia bombi]TEA27470.1 16S rRNA (guanine(527)-N(7))-methyltransferase RsmG [Candidatus Schmidhempelia bombi str. Bimp]
MLKQNLDKLLHKNNIALSEQQVNLLIDYVNLLAKWNKAYNLTSVRDPNEMLIKHIIDSLVVSPYLSGDKFIDVGTGPGLPGVPLAIINPDKHFTLVDSLGKRIRFLKQVKFELNLTNIDPIQRRVEEVKEIYFDGVISRAFASLQDMLSWCDHLPNQNGIFYALKGQYPSEELALLQDTYKVENIICFNIADMQADRHLIMIKKAQ